MSEQEQVPSNVENPVSLAVNSGSETIGANLGNITNNALNSVFRFLKTQYGKALVLNKSVYIKYLHNAYERYNKVRTLVTGNEPRNIIGEKNIYVQINVKNEARNKEVDTSTIEPLLNVSKNLIIRGTGGAGKSMLFRYLFLNTINNGKYIPIFLELRKITNQDTGINGIFNLIYNCMSDFDVTFDKEQFKYSLGLGNYVFFLDGFDEIKKDLLTQTAETIQKFASKYPKNSYIISSRPDRNFSPLQTFTILDCMDLSKEQAIELSKKLGEDSEKTKDFCKQLDTHLFNEHKDFTSNPLLLSMMFLTFMRNNSIPEYRIDFYEQCYRALYAEHDSKNKGSYKREFQCAVLDERSFKKLFSRFCFKTYFDNKYEFTEEELINEMQWCIEKLELESKVSAEDYINDLCNICLIIKEGNTYRFAHRSFQTYFSAVYTETLPDDSQKKLFRKLLSTDFLLLSDFFDYFKLLEPIEHNRLFVNTFSDCLNNLQLNCENFENTAICFFKMIFSSISILKKKTNIKVRLSFNNDKIYFNNIYIIFDEIFFKKSPLNYTKSKEKLPSVFKKLLTEGNCYKFDEIDNCKWLDEKDRNIMYDYLIRSYGIDELVNKIDEYNKKMIDSVPENPKNFFDAF